MEEKRKTVSSAIQWISDVTSLITNHGAWKILSSTLVLCMCIMMITITLNPGIIIEKIDQYFTLMEERNREFRKENDPLIRAELKNAMYELGANRVSVFEFHNGKENPASLGFYYADMTYETISEGETGVSKQYQDLNLSLLHMSTVLYQNGYWFGTTDELYKIDPTLAELIESNGTKWIAFFLLEGTAELGILEISFKEVPPISVQKEVGRSIRRVGAHIASKLDFKAHYSK